MACPENTARQLVTQRSHNSVALLGSRAPGIRRSPDSTRPHRALLVALAAEPKIERFRADRRVFQGAIFGLSRLTLLSVGKSQLASKVFPHDSSAGPDAVELVPHRLRRKLAGSDVRIVTIRGLGYMLEGDVDADAATGI